MMLGYDRNMSWWELIILASLAYFANDIVLFVARLCLGRQRLRRLTSRFEIPTSLRD
jgi:membrane protein DedA with SNARE-associated domain